MHFETCFIRHQVGNLMKVKRAVWAGGFRDHLFGLDIVLADAVEALGAHVTRIDYRLALQTASAAEMAEVLGRATDGADILFVGKGQGLTPDCLRVAREQGVKIVLLYFDYRGTPEQWLTDLLPYVDAFFMTSGGEALNHYHRIGRPRRSAFLPNPAIHNPYPSVDVRTNGEPSVIYTATPHPFAGPERRQVASYLYRHPLGRVFGGAELLRFGPPWVWRALVRLGVATPSPVLRGRDYAAAILEASLAVSASRGDVEGYTSARLLHYLSLGVPVLAYAFPGIDRLFEPGVHLDTFRTVKELDQKISYYLAHDGVRRRLGATGQTFVLDQYAPTRVMRYVTDVAFDGASDMYPHLAEFGRFEGKS